MNPISTPALILKMNEVGESDLLAELYTRDMGRLSALAKGAKRSKKRFFGVLLTGHLIQASLLPGRRQGGLRLLQGAALKDAFVGLRLDYRNLLFASPVLEVLLKAFAAEDPGPMVFDLSVSALQRIEKAVDKYEAASALAVFLCRLATEAGYALSLNTCCMCGNECRMEASPILSLAGGYICPSCLDKSPLPGRSGMDGQAMSLAVNRGLFNSLKAAQTLDPRSLARLGFRKADLAPCLIFMARFWEHISGRDINSLHLATRQLA